MKHTKANIERALELAVGVIFEASPDCDVCPIWLDVCSGKTKDCVNTITKHFLAKAEGKAKRGRK